MSTKNADKKQTKQAISQNTNNQSPVRSSDKQKNNRSKSKQKNIPHNRNDGKFFHENNFMTNRTYIKENGKDPQYRTRKYHHTINDDDEFSDESFDEQPYDLPNAYQVPEFQPYFQPEFFSQYQHPFPYQFQQQIPHPYQYQPELYQQFHPKQHDELDVNSNIFESEKLNDKLPEENFSNDYYPPIPDEAYLPFLPSDFDAEYKDPQLLKEKNIDRKSNKKSNKKSNLPAKTYKNQRKYNDPAYHLNKALYYYYNQNPNFNPFFKPLPYKFGYPIYDNFDSYYDQCPLFYYNTCGKIAKNNKKKHN